jgi:hypothetical protein
MGTRKPVLNATGSPASNWNAADYLRVVCAMIPLQDKGMHRRDAMNLAQRLLPPDKQRPESKLKRNLVADLYTKARDAAAKMTPEARAKLVAKMPPELAAELAATSKPGTKAGPRKLPQLAQIPPREVRKAANGSMRPVHTIHHTETELALIARRVAHFQIDLKDTRALSRLFKVAQAIELPPERHRGDGSIGAGMRQIRLNLVRVHGLCELLAAYPFDPNRRTYIAPSEAEPADPHNFAAEAEPAQEAAAPIPAPTPAPLPRSSLSDPIRAFGDAFAQSMHTLLHAMTHEMMSELELRVSQMSERLMQRTVETLSQGIGPLVHSALERELGSGISAPAADDVPMTLPDGAALPKALQLDVVGLIGHQVSEVKAQLNGYAAGMRFIDADRVDSWTPRQTVILNTKFISHNAEGKCRKAGVKPIRVQGGAGAILNAIRTLCENEGISLPH